jgi:type IV pilus assembly protein PilM
MVQLQRDSQGWAVQDILDKELPAATDGDESGQAEGIVQAIKEAGKNASFSGKSVVSAMPCDKLDIIPISVSVGENENLEEALVREARAYLSYDIEDAVIDYLPFRVGPADATKTPDVQKTLLVAARREDVDAHLAILRAARLKPLAIDTSAAALARVFSVSDCSGETRRLVVNLSERSTSLVVLCGSSVFVDRRIPWGRENLITRLTDSLKLDPSRAGDLIGRIGLCPSGGRGEDETRVAERMLETVGEIVAPELERLAEEVEKVLVYFFSEMRGVNIDELCLVGVGGEVRNLDRHLGSKIGIPAAIFDPMEALGLEKRKAAADSVDRRGPRFSVALGLALRGVETLPLKARKGMAHAAAQGH